jgi:hypothetical protein
MGHNYLSNILMDKEQPQHDPPTLKLFPYSACITVMDRDKGGEVLRPPGGSVSQTIMFRYNETLCKKHRKNGFVPV